MAFDRLDRRVGGDLHIRRSVQGGAGVAARHGGDGGEHVVLDERTRNHDADLQVDTSGDDIDHLLDGKTGTLCKITLCDSTVGDFGLGHVFQRSRQNLVDSSSATHCRGDVDAVASARGVEGLLKRNVSELVRLLVVDEQVHVGSRERLLGVDDGGRGHAVELANLRRALQHLNRILVCEKQHQKHVNVRIERVIGRTHKEYRIKSCSCAPSETSNCELGEMRTRYS